MRTAGEEAGSVYSRGKEGRERGGIRRTGLLLRRYQGTGGGGYFGVDT